MLLAPDFATCVHFFEQRQKTPVMPAITMFWRPPASRMQISMLCNSHAQSAWVLVSASQPAINLHACCKDRGAQAHSPGLSRRCAAVQQDAIRDLAARRAAEQRLATAQAQLDEVERRAETAREQTDAARRERDTLQVQIFCCTTLSMLGVL